MLLYACFQRAVEIEHRIELRSDTIAVAGFIDEKLNKIFVSLADKLFTDESQ